MAEGKREDELVIAIMAAGLEAMTKVAVDAGSVIGGTMQAAAAHILAVWIAIETRNDKEIDECVRLVVEQLRRQVEYHRNDAFVRDMKARRRVVGRIQ
jgi:hypothetical protein